MPPEEQQAIAAEVYPRPFQKGEPIFWAGERGDFLYLVQSGLVKIFTISRDGKEKALAILGSGDCFGEMALLDEEPRSANAAAMSDTMIWTLGRREFLELLRTSHDLVLKLFRILSSRLRETNKMVEALIYSDSRQRLVQILLELVQYNQTREVKINQTELAALAGLARETTSRLLKQLEEEGIIGRRGKTILLLENDLCQIMEN